MRKFGWAGFALVVSGGVAATGVASAGDTSSSRDKELIDCRAPGAPYKKYGCLDVYLGDGFLERLVNYYRLELGLDKAPTVTKAPPPRRSRLSDAHTTSPTHPLYQLTYHLNH